MICKNALEHQFRHLVELRVNRRLKRLWEEHGGAPPATVVQAACQAEHERVQFAAKTYEASPGTDLDACVRLLTRGVRALEGMDC